MKSNFRKIAVAAAVGAVLGVSGAAQADEVLFPYFATGRHAAPTGRPMVRW